jgi:hypothetical protein
VLVVADGAPVLADPGEGPFHDPAAGQHLEGVGSRSATMWSVIFKLAAQAASLPEYPASAQTRRTRRQARWVFHSSGRAPWRSWTEGGHHVLDQAGGVHGDVPLAAVDFLSVIPVRKSILLL